MIFFVFRIYFMMLNKIYDLFESRVQSDCTNQFTRKLLAPLLTSMDLYEKERGADIRRQLFMEACNEFQWYYWTNDDYYYGGTGEWREFPPSCTTALNKAVREGKNTIQITLSQRVYTVNLNEMTKSPENGYHHSHGPTSIFVKAFKRENFNIDKFNELIGKLNEPAKKHVFVIKGILKLIDSSSLEPLDTELATSALNLLYRLITRRGMVEEFMLAGGIKILMHLCCQREENDTASNAQTIHMLISLILRHCIDIEEGVLRESFQAVIKNTCNGLPITLLEATSRRHALRTKRYQKDPRRVFRLLTPLAATAPQLFVDVVKEMLTLNSKKNDLQLNEPSKSTAEPQYINLREILNIIVRELPLNGDDDEAVELKTRALRTGNLLKLIAEILRSYNTASSIFAQMTTSTGQSVMKQLVERYILMNGEEEDENGELALSTKAVLACMISSNTTSKITDQIVDDLKALLYAIVEEYTDGICLSTTSSARTKLMTKLAEKLTILARLTMLLRETFIQQTFNMPTAISKQAALLTKSFHKKNLLNDFVKAIWSLPIHERQGHEAINTLLKLLEGIIGKDANGFIAAEGSGHHQQDTDSENQQQQQPDNTISVAANGHEQAHRHQPTAEPTTSSSVMAPQDEQQIETSRSSHTESMHTVESNSADASTNMQQVEHEHGHQDQDTTMEMEDNTSHQEDEDSSTQSEDMDTAEEMDAAQEAAAAAAEAADEVEEMEERNSEQMNETEAMAHQNLIAEEMADDDDDEDDEDDEEDEEEEGEGDMQIGFDEVPGLSDDMAEFTQNMSNEVNLLRQDVHRITMNLNNAYAAQQLQQAMLHNFPRNIRIVQHHPRGIGRAVLRVSNNPHPGAIPIQFGIRRGGRNSFVNQLMSQLVSTAPWPSGANTNAADEHTIERKIPYFLDRIADQCRVLDPFAPFHIGIVLSSFLMSVIELVEAPVEEEEKKRKETELPVQPQEPIAQHDIQSGQRAEEPTEAQSGQRAEEPTEAQSGQREEEPTEAQPVEQHLGLDPMTEQSTSAGIDKQGNQETDQTAQNATQQETNQSTETQEHSHAPEDIQPQAQQEQPQREGGDNEDNQVPEGVDPAFLAALPEDMRQEVIRDHLLQQQMNAAPSAQPTHNDQDLPPERLAAILGMEVPEGMDPAFLAALPEDIFNEVVRDHQRQQELTRQRQAQRQAQNQAARHHHPSSHYRHFAMPHFFTHGGRIVRGVGTMGHHQIPTTLSNERAIQLLDRESITTLILLYFFEQDKVSVDKIKKLLRYICVHPASCDFTIWALISMLDGLANFDAIDYIECDKSQLGWINNLQTAASLDKNERILKITPHKIFINQQIRIQTAHQIIDTLYKLAQGYANHFMPKGIRDCHGKCDNPPDSSHFWQILRSINNKSTEQTLKESAKMDSLHEIVADSLEKSPFAFIFNLSASKLAKDNQSFLDKVIKTTYLLSQRLVPNFDEKASDTTKQWVGQRMIELINVMMDKSTDDSLRDGRALIAQLLGTFASERPNILSTLHDAILKNGEDLHALLTKKE